MEHAFSYGFDLAFLRLALRRDYFWKGLWTIVAFAVLFLVARQLPEPGPRIVPHAIGVALPFVLLVLIYTLRTASRRTYELWKLQAPDERIEMRFDDEGFEVVFAAGSTRYAWSGLRRLWRYHDVWLIEVVKNVSVFFPPSAARPETLEFIQERCRAAGVRS